jgi:hypothetical protein
MPSRETGDTRRPWPLCAPGAHNERNIRLTPSRMRPTRWRQSPIACDRYRETRGRTVAALKVRCRQRRLADGRMIRLRAKREDFLGRSAAGR